MQTILNTKICVLKKVEHTIFLKCHLQKKIKASEQHNFYMRFGIHLMFWNYFIYGKNVNAFATSRSRGYELFFADFIWYENVRR